MDPTQRIRSLLRRWDIDVRRYSRSFYGRRARILAGVDVVLDVGANRGQFARALRVHGYANRIVSFEPLQEPFQKLSGLARLDPNWSCYQVGIGDRKGSMQMNVAANSLSSSFLPMLPRHLVAAPHSRYTRQEKVQVTTLDSFFADQTAQERLFLKIDVQGFELAVLRGAESTLEQVLAIEMELSLVPLYEGQATLCPTLDELRARGFELVSVEEDFEDVHSNRVLQVDGLFLRS